MVREAVGAAEAAATSVVAYAEARAGFARRFREGDFTEDEHRKMVSDLDQDWRTYNRMFVFDLVASRAGELAERHALRGFDAIHLASALQFSEKFEDLHFLAFDDRLTGAARDANLSLYGNQTSPGHRTDNDSGNS